MTERTPSRSPDKALPSASTIENSAGHPTGSLLVPYSYAFFSLFNTSEPSFTAKNSIGSGLLTVKVCSKHFGAISIAQQAPGVSNWSSGMISKKGKEKLVLAGQTFKYFYSFS